MCPIEAKVFVAEDNARWQDRIRRSLERDGHQIVLTASSREQALEMAGRLEGEGIQVATIDGNLSEGDYSGNDGKALLDAIRQQAPEVKTVGMSGSNIPGVDVDLGKTKLSELSRVIREL